MEVVPLELAKYDEKCNLFFAQRILSGFEYTKCGVESHEAISLLLLRYA